MRLIYRTSLSKKLSRPVTDCVCRAQKSQAAQSKHVQRRLSKSVELASSNATRAFAALQKEEKSRMRMQQWLTDGSRLQSDMFSSLQVAL